MALVASEARPGQALYTITAAEAAEVNDTEENSEALALEVDGAVDQKVWEYSATAEDNGTVGVLDGEPGVIYTGTNTRPVIVSFSNIDYSAGTIAPAATDTVGFAVFKNSTEQGIADEGYVAELDTATVEMNGTILIDSVATNDVIRAVLVCRNEDTSEEAVDVEVDGGGSFALY